MVSFGFFNSSNGDRRYSSEDISRIFSFLITDGVLMTYGDKFFTTPSTSNLGVILGTGWAWFNHTWTMSDAKIPFALSEADPSLDRIDTIYLKVDARSLGRVNSLGLLEGSPALNPKAPTFPTETDVYYHPLAHVKVRHGVTRISASDIDILVGKTNAPFITSILQTTDITTLFQGWSEQFGTKMTAWQSDYEAKIAEWENEVDTLQTSLTSNVNAVIASANQQLQTQRNQFTADQTARQTAFDTAQTNRQNTFNTSLQGWEADFTEWFENLQTYLSQDVVTAIWADLDKLKADMETKLNKNSEWPSPTTVSVPFKGENKDRVTIPKFGDTKYSDLSEYFRIFGDSKWVDYTGFFPGPKAIKDAIMKISGCFGPVVMRSSGAYNVGNFSGWITFILIGGGGGGGGGIRASSSSSALTTGGGGGGGGSVVIRNHYVEAYSNINVQIGSAGEQGGYVTSASSSIYMVGHDGGTTSVSVTKNGDTFRISASGGGGGRCSSDTTNIYTLSGGTSKNGGGGGGGGAAIRIAPSTSFQYNITTQGGNGSEKYCFGGGAGGGGGVVLSGSNLSQTVSRSGGQDLLSNSSYVGAGRGGLLVINNTGATSTSSSPSRGRNGIGSETGVIGNQTNSSSTIAIFGGGGNGGVSTFGNGGSISGAVSSTKMAVGGGGGGGIFDRGGGYDFSKSGNDRYLAPKGFGHGGYGGSSFTSGVGIYGGGPGGGWGLVPFPELLIPSITASSGAVIMIMPGGYL